MAERADDAPPTPAWPASTWDYYGLSPHRDESLLRSPLLIRPTIVGLIYRGNLPRDSPLTLGNGSIAGALQGRVPSQSMSTRSKWFKIGARKGNTLCVLKKTRYIKASKEDKHLFVNYVRFLPLSSLLLKLQDSLILFYRAVYTLYILNLSFAGVSPESPGIKKTYVHDSTRVASCVGNCLL